MSLAAGDVTSPGSSWTPQRAARLLVVDGRVTEPAVYAAPFGLVVGVGGFEYGSLEREKGLEPSTTCLGSRDSTN